MRFAQILNNKAHWIFETEERPQFAPNVILVDITDKPEVQEGWDYDEITGKFSEPVPIEPEPPLPTLAEQLSERDKQIAELKTQLTATEQVTTENTLAQQELLELLIDMGVL